MKGERRVRIAGVGEGTREQVELLSRQVATQVSGRAQNAGTEWSVKTSGCVRKEPTVSETARRLSCEPQIPGVEQLRTTTKMVVMLACVLRFQQLFGGDSRRDAAGLANT